MSRKSASLIVCAYFAILTFAAAAVHAAATHKPRPVRVIGHGQIKFNGAGPERWAARARMWRRAYLAERRALLARPSTREAITLACLTYGSCTTLWRKARCESGLYPYARNPSGASGLFQFLPSTFASTPFASLSIFSPYANAMAAGWMHTHGRGGEWVCQ